MDNEAQKPNVLALTSELGHALGGAMESIQSRDLLVILDGLFSVSESFRALSDEVNALAERMLTRFAVERDHRDVAAALATAMISENDETLQVLNQLLGEVRMRGLSTPEEAHLILVAFLELFGFCGRLLEERGEDPQALLRQAIANRNSTLDSLG